MRSRNQRGSAKTAWRAACFAEGDFITRAPSSYFDIQRVYTRFGFFHAQLEPPVVTCLLLPESTAMLNSYLRLFVSLSPETFGFSMQLEPEQVAHAVTINVPFFDVYV
ncbi:hypothetical protein [Paenibacillus marchantiophytorum]|uniref:hypothetical protein n=1 Tax=Paenibacillus marchantiophytorum TaxID=1619310 RepID=UPI001E58C595|nr:hypothetical protein [Paenibacillus marchantiophytorum]